MKEPKLVDRRTLVTSLGAAGVMLSCAPTPESPVQQATGNQNWSLPDENQVRREFDQTRSRKVIFVSHCMLNQNARITTAAEAACRTPSGPTPYKTIQHPATATSAGESR